MPEPPIFTFGLQNYNIFCDGQNLLIIFFDKYADFVQFSFFIFYSDGKIMPVLCSTSGCNEGAAAYNFLVAS